MVAPLLEVTSLLYPHMIQLLALVFPGDISLSKNGFYSAEDNDLGKG